MEQVTPPAEADIVIHFGSGLGQIRHGQKLPSAAHAWTWVGGPRWFQPGEYPFGQKTQEDEIRERAEVIATRIKARDEAGKFDLTGRVPSIADFHKRVQRAKEREQEQRAAAAERKGPPPGY